ncbi:MAG: PaaX family transcriptional regulator C-terminal domain-containing protein [Acidimicrobiales bacterium]
MADFTTTTPSRAFILGLADTDGHLDAGPLYAVAEAAGFTTTTIRLALKRLIEAGFVDRRGRGRKASLQLTPAGLSERLEDLAWVAFAHRADAGLDVWDGRWNLVSFEIPEDKRPARDALRNRITELLGAPVGGALYVSPHPWKPWIDAIATANNVADRVTTITATQLHHRGLTEPAAVARSLWPIDELAADYKAFVARWEQQPAAPDQVTTVRLAFQASTEIEALLRRDPLLPDKILPDDFAGQSARKLYLEVMANLAEEPLVAAANIYTAYRSAIDRALSQTAEEFWSVAFADTRAKPA